MYLKSAVNKFKLKIIMGHRAIGNLKNVRENCDMDLILPGRLAKSVNKTSYDFRIKMMFGSSLPASSCLWEGSRLIYVICVCLRILESNTYCVVFLFCFSSFCVLYVASFSGLSIFDCLFSIL